VETERRTRKQVNEIRRMIIAKNGGITKHGQTAIARLLPVTGACGISCPTATDAGTNANRKQKIRLLRNFLHDHV
jgi:hypothetical protein